MFLARVVWLPVTSRSHSQTSLTDKCKISIMIVLLYCMYVQNKMAHEHAHIYMYVYLVPLIMIVKSLANEVRRHKLMSVHSIRIASLHCHTHRIDKTIEGRSLLEHYL